ncbi:MAG: ADP-L-glycero-D-mannoheptose-6-epimerase [Parcubacteria group bacterium GW2011_GWA2_43_11]|nr:MAG: ADP-L-glycero-D-mannoheptose-6-epimerase [Parcubacteria group bacterium GW2011_GWA2_43_11]
MFSAIVLTMDKNIIVVTGGAGFVGSHLIEALVKDPNNQVISLDNYFTGSKDNHIAGAEYREGHTKDIATLIPETPDMIYHLGEYSRVRQSLDEPERVWDLNMHGTLAVLEYWRKTKAKLLYAGSSTKFTDTREDGVEGRNLAPYTWAKAANTDLVVNYARWYDLSHVTTYFYNVYGPRELSGKQGTVVGIFADAFRNKKPLTVSSPGTQERCFTHVLDTVSGILLVAEKGEGDGYGIGTDESHSLLEVAEMFGGEIEMLPQTKSTRSTSKVDSEKVKTLGWKPKYALKDYIEELKSSK